jgi:membrane protease YdiL (CAAX protease family)
MPLWQSVLLFGLPAVFFYLVTHFGIQWMVENTGIPFILSWFLLGGLLIFVPLFVIALVGFRIEGREFTWAEIRDRLRLNPMTRGDWYWTIGAMIFIAITSGIIYFAGGWLAGITNFFPKPSTELPFMEFHGFGEGEYWMFAVWLPFFFFNIFGEELLWHGYILPRQEAAHGKWAWVVNFLLWTMFHACFGAGMVIFLLPILACLPFVVQKRKNTWIGIIIHAAINGSGFIMVAIRGV